MRRTIGLLLLIVCASVWAKTEKTEECTVFIAGKDTTADGSILFAKTEDDAGNRVDFLWYVPRKTYPDGAVVKLQAGGQIPQVRETYAYFWDQCPGMSYSNGIVNEWGVAFGSNGCRSKEDPVDQVQARGDLVDGGLGFEFRMILAERSKTAREAVLLAAKLLDTYGYNASGRNLNIVDANEAWQLQMVRGKQYVARRVRDDEVAIIANTYSIRQVDAHDKENYVCSPRLVEYAIQRGWYDPARDGAFDFAKAYAPEAAHTAPSNTHRQWDLARLLNKDFPLSWKDAEAGKMPVSVKPDRKLTVKDIMAILRNHYEGTALDESKAYERTPHLTQSTVCNYGTHRSTVIQLRHWLPADIGTVTWRALTPPCSSMFVPWYLGATRIPEVYRRAPENLYTTDKSVMEYHFSLLKETDPIDPDSASGVFGTLSEHVDQRYAKTISAIQKGWSHFEETEFLLQPVIEETALRLYQRDKDLGREYLTLYSNAQAVKAIETAKKLTKELASKQPAK